MKRKFVINKYKGYSIRNHYFVAQPNGGCVLETDDQDVINLIEGADGYGVFIHPAETPEEIEAMKAKDERRSRISEPEPDYPLDEKKKLPEPEEEEKKNEETDPQEEENKEEEAPPIAHQGARSTHTGRRQRKGMLITPKEK